MFSRAFEGMSAFSRTAFGTAKALESDPDFANSAVKDLPALGFRVQGLDLGFKV